MTAKEKAQDIAEEKKACLTEQDVFLELEKLCQSPGYLHAIAYLCFRDNTIHYPEDEMRVDDVLQQFSMDRLLRTEISTLLGLACKIEPDLSHPGPANLQSYIDKTESLLKEIHIAMVAPVKELQIESGTIIKKHNYFDEGKAFREPIFYGGESAYLFQYKDLSLRKYRNDSGWFVNNKGYSVDQADKIISAIMDVQSNNLNELIPSQLKELHPDEWTMLPGFSFNIMELSKISGLDEKIVKSFVDSFVCPSNIDKSVFKALDDFNPINAYPIIKADDDKYILLQSYSLLEAFYETPFFWFNSDDEYKVEARKNRGDFTEAFSEERLKLVFGSCRVFSNIDIYRDKNNRVGEIDVLVIYANRAIVLQAKSKKLTIAARKGNDKSLKEDFRKAVQSAYDQAFSCASMLNDQSYKLYDSAGKELKIERNFEEIYPLCVVSDHYPSLSYQCKSFLKYTSTDIIKPPFVMDVFLLDVLTEMLQSPLHLLSYINRRVEYSSRVLSNHELTVLAYHLKKNLWIEGDLSLLHLADDICADLDLSMLVRRTGVPGIDTPEGVLTNYKGTTYGCLIEEIDSLEDPSVIDFGLMLLSISGETVEDLNKGIDYYSKMSVEDGMHHDLTLVMSDSGTGLTIHINNDEAGVSNNRLLSHCEARKYISKANTWYGICLDPFSKKIRFGVSLGFEWTKSDEMDKKTAGSPEPQRLRAGNNFNLKTKRRHGMKVGRNDPCPCGSNKKYKKCCI